MKDTLGDRMKEYYEDRTRIFLPRRTNTIIRVDGKAFHTFTRGMDKPFDEALMESMDQAAGVMCQQMQGVRFAFIQSDEISVLLTDYDNLDTAAWFNGNVQKMASVSASIATAAFNGEMWRHGKDTRPFMAMFDARVFTIPSLTEVENYFIWRQQDTTRNSIQSVAQSMFSHKELEGKSTSQMQDMMMEAGMNWNTLAPRYKRGRIATREVYNHEGEVRSKWTIKDVPIFTQERAVLSKLISNEI